ncbi:DUF3857 domain-containing protein [Marixanthomonas spongiae]|uniref:DUF3857 domain-containing protein n=1 Tax=Marixanthomonas spongiae TaxID=2174845 RepID=A0A2U0I593_9FLAO|nr:DUF3857 domain-containing protein [Marixanthomonas spongiae]PVW16281.1 hypothetical protein DDV96_03175 [Marixanthomonas spongiae]
MKPTASLALIFLLYINFSQAQQRQSALFGQPTEEELSMTSFTQDPEAPAIILFEQGDYQFKKLNRYIRIVKKVHRKIKVIDAKKFNNAAIEIPLLIGDKNEEKLKNIKAVTHNADLKKYVGDDKFFTTKQTEKRNVVRFTFPDIRDGSILEYKYTIVSPFFFNFNGWEFQQDIPTVYSEFTSEIPGNFKYSIALKGGRKLTVKEERIKKNCLYMDGYTPADCHLTVYAMADVPAFKKEAYMLAKSNYKAGVKYELREFMDYTGLKHKYSKTWDDVEDEFKTDKNIGRQLNNTNFFRKNLPENILKISDKLKKAKAIYTFVQNHYRWNGKHRLFNEVRVRDAFKEGVGNTSEINLALINALQASGLDAKLMLISTRDNGLPTDVYPILTDFNRAIALLTVNNETFLLDAVDKQAPFGVIPFQDLNIKGRVMDFKKGSYWHPLTPHKKNMLYVNTKIKATEEGIFTGTLTEVRTGYIAMNERKHIQDSNFQDYVNEKETNSSLHVSELKIEHKTNLEKPLKINYNVALETELIGDKVYVNPYFFETYFTENPFTANERNFPINFGYPIITTYLISIDLDNKYTVEQLPENKVIKLFDDIGECTVIYTQAANKINIRFSFKLMEEKFPVKAYQGIKDFFGKMIDFQTQSPILLKKK